MPIGTVRVHGLTWIKQLKYLQTGEGVEELFEWISQVVDTERSDSELAAEELSDRIELTQVIPEEKIEGNNKKCC